MRELGYFKIYKVKDSKKASDTMLVFCYDGEEFYIPYVQRYCASYEADVDGLVNKSLTIEVNNFSREIVSSVEELQNKKIVGKRKNV